MSRKLGLLAGIAALAALAGVAQGAQPSPAQETAYWRAGAEVYLRVWRSAEGTPQSVIVEHVLAPDAPKHDADIAQAPWDLVQPGRWVEPGLMRDAPGPGDYRVVLEDGEGAREIAERSGTWTSIRAYGPEGVEDEAVENSAASLKILLRADQMSIFRIGPQTANFTTVRPAKGPDGAAGAVLAGENCAWGTSQTTPDSSVLTCATADGIVLARQALDPYGGEPMLRVVELKRGPRPLAEVLPSPERLRGFTWRQP